MEVDKIGQEGEEGVSARGYCLGDYMVYGMVYLWVMWLLGCLRW